MYVMKNKKLKFGKLYDCKGTKANPKQNS